MPTAPCSSVVTVWVSLRSRSSKRGANDTSLGRKDELPQARTVPESAAATGASFLPAISTETVFVAVLPWMSAIVTS